MLIVNVKQSIYEEPQHAMLYFPVPKDIFKDLPVQPDFPHITLLYLGTVTEQANIIDVQAILQELASLGKPAAKLNGIARFNVDENGNPFVLLVDSKDLLKYRMLAMELAEDGGEHGFIPHITMSYLEKEQPMPFDMIDQIEVPLNWICYAEGENNRWCLHIESGD